MSTSRSAPGDADVPPGALGPGDRPLTTAEIADLAGVSVATVSKVLNGRAEVAAQTRALVETVIRERGHRRQKRRSSSAPLVELLIHEVDSEYALSMVKGIASVAGPEGLAVVMSDYAGRSAPGADWARSAPGADWARGVLARRSLGVIAAYARPDRQHLDRLASRGVPLVLVDPTGEPEPGVPSVGADNWSGGLLAARYLLGLGHRRIAVVTGPDEVLASRARLDGFRAAMATAGVPVDPDLVRHGNFGVEDGIHHVRDLLRGPRRPTAVFAFNDTMAVGAYHAAAEAGLRIPDDVSVVGFDDLPGSRWAVPTMTTVRQPLTDMAAAATGMLLELIGGEVPLPSRLVLATELVVRGSSGPVPEVSADRPS